jgi:hypothetical protein
MVPSNARWHVNRLEARLACADAGQNQRRLKPRGAVKCVRGN